MYVIDTRHYKVRSQSQPDRRLKTAQNILDTHYYNSSINHKMLILKVTVTNCHKIDLTVTAFVHIISEVTAL